MYRIFLLIGLLEVASLGFAQYGISQSIQLILDSCEHPQQQTAGTERIYYPEEVKYIYGTLEYQPLWLVQEHRRQLIDLVDKAWLDGLLPADYHHAWLVTHATRPVFSAIEEANNDLLLTDAFLTYAHHLLEGKSNPELLFPGKWERTVPTNLSRIVLAALRNKTFANTLDSLRPKTPIYARLMNELQSLEDSDWAPVLTPAGKDLEVGMEDDRIKLIRQRLGTGDSSNSCYDSALYHRVIEFQSHRGLVTDGLIGKKTLGALNESRAAVVGRIKANMERYRWLPHEFSDEYVVVNIPDYNLRLIEGDSVSMSMRVIVGRPDRSTPVFNSAIGYLILNPTWTVPPTIFKEDVLPAVKRDIKYLDRHNLRVVNRKGEEIDPSSLPWQKYTYRNFPYELRQDPGTFNSLGLIKFQFPNRYKVFLHDTNAPKLFSNSYRALSSGCIRIEQPFELATRLMRGTKWSMEKLAKETRTGKTRAIVLEKPMPITLEYFTIFTDEYGVLQVRDDIYGIDQVVLKSIETPLK